MLWGGWGEIKRECAGHDGKGEERRETSRLFPLPIVHHALSIFLIIAIFIAGYPAGASAEKESHNQTISFILLLKSCYLSLSVDMPTSVSTQATCIGAIEN